MSDEELVVQGQVDALTRVLYKYGRARGGVAVGPGGQCGPVEVAVQYECDGCCCHATNARFAEVVDGVLVLVAPDNEFIKVKCESKGKKVFCKLVIVLIIPLDRICSVSIGDLDLCDCDDKD